MAPAWIGIDTMQPDAKEIQVVSAQGVGAGGGWEVRVCVCVPGLVFFDLGRRLQILPLPLGYLS